MSYADMQAAIENEDPQEAVDAREAEATLLREVFRMLPERKRREIARELERQREAFARSSVPGHVPWYPTKVAVCAAFERLMENS